MNNWTTQQKLMAPQSVDTVPIYAYLDETTELEISVTVVNGFLVGMDLRGFPKSAFQSLEDDVKAGLEFWGFKVTGRDSVDVDI